MDFLLIVDKDKLYHMNLDLISICVYSNRSIIIIGSLYIYYIWIQIKQHEIFDLYKKIAKNQMLFCSFYYIFHLYMYNQNLDVG